MLIQRKASFVIALGVLACGAATAADTLTLDQAIAIALEKNHSLQNSAIDIEKAQDRLAAVRTRQFPGISVYMLGAQQLRSFDYTLEKGVLGTYTGSGPIPSEDVSLKTPLAPTGVISARVAQPLTSLIRIHRNMDALKTGVKIAEEEARADRQKIVRDVKRAYYGLQQVEASLRSVRETAKLYQEVEKLTANWVMQEVALKGDLLASQTRVAKTEQLEVMLKNQRTSGKEHLNVLLGRDITTEFEVEPAVDVFGIGLDLEEARAVALRNRPEIRKGALREQQAEQDYRAKKAEFIPDVAAEYNNLTFVNWGRFMPTQSSSIGVSLSWEPFDWGRRKHEAAEKKRSVLQARNAQLEAVNAVLADVNDKHRQLQYRQAELKVARLSQQTATENLRVANNKFRLQAVLFKDVLQAQVGLEESNSEYQQALTSFWNARADFERALGEDR